MTVTTEDVQAFRTGFALGAEKLDGTGDATADIGNITDKILDGYDALVLLAHQSAIAVTKVADSLSDLPKTESDALSEIAMTLGAVVPVGKEQRDILTSQLDSIGEDIEDALQLISDACEAFETKATAEGTQPEVPVSPVPASVRVSPALERHNVG